MKLMSCMLFFVVKKVQKGLSAAKKETLQQCAAEVIYSVTQPRSSESVRWTNLAIPNRNLQ